MPRSAEPVNRHTIDAVSGFMDTEGFGCAAYYLWRFASLSTSSFRLGVSCADEAVRSCAPNVSPNSPCSRVRSVRDVAVRVPVRSTASRQRLRCRRCIAASADLARIARPGHPVHQRAQRGRVSAWRGTHARCLEGGRNVTACAGCGDDHYRRRAATHVVDADADPARS